MVKPKKKIKKVSKTLKLSQKGINIKGFYNRCDMFSLFDDSFEIIAKDKLLHLKLGKW